MGLGRAHELDGLPNGGFRGRLAHGFRGVLGIVLVAGQLPKGGRKFCTSGLDRLDQIRRVIMALTP